MTGWESQLRKGVVELAVLAAIGRGETYGYRIVSDLQRLDGFQLTESTVYPVLARLRGMGFWRFAQKSRRRDREDATIGSLRPVASDCGGWPSAGRRFLIH